MSEMTLSEAIKAGAKLRPQGFFGRAMRATPRDPWATCALGAAQEAAGILHVYAGGVSQTGNVWTQFPILEEYASGPCGCLSKRDAPVAHIITHLNDEHRWRRETIAAWVAHLEKGDK